MRKVRSKSQIVKLVQYSVTHSGKIFSSQNIRTLIEKDRVKRESMRLLITQMGPRRALRQLGDTKRRSYASMARDTVAFAKGVGIFKVVNGKIQCPERIRNINSLIESDYPSAIDSLIELILASRYKAYFLFISHLQEIGGHFHIPRRFKGRTGISGIKDYLMENEFQTDVASFYTIRDLLYDFSLLNWRMQKDREHLCLTCEFVPEKAESSGNYCRNLKLRNGSILYERKISTNSFEDSLVRAYKLLTRNSWGNVVNILELRDIVAEELGISDTQFNNELLALAKGSPEVIVELSRGTLFLGRSSGVLIKGLNLPQINAEMYVTYVRLLKRRK
ncbi:hypothetical protein KAU88_02525 [Candidatus Bathyarchaeota archaeon]|nr:hypothetical protein [Candidatus Bathyarchaeota archaeon]